MWWGVALELYSCHISVPRPPITPWHQGHRCWHRDHPGSVEIISFPGPSEYPGRCGYLPARAHFFSDHPQGHNSSLETLLLQTVLILSLITHTLVGDWRLTAVTAFIELYVFHRDTLVRLQHALSICLLTVTVSRNAIIFPVFLIRKLKQSCSSKRTHTVIGSPSEPWKSDGAGRGAGGTLSSPHQLFSHSLNLQCLSLNLMSWKQYSSFKSCSLGHTQTSQDNLSSTVSLIMLPVEQL